MSAIVLVFLAATLLASIAALALQVQARRRRSSAERTPENVFGDLRFEVSGLRVAQERLTERIDRFERAMDHNQARFEQALAEIEGLIRSRPSYERPEKAPLGIGPEHLRNGTATKTGPDRIATDAEELLRLCDSTPPEEGALRTWAVQKDVVLAFLVGQSTDWYLLRLERAGAAAVVPAMRRPMATVPLADYYDLVSYNGVGPLKAADIKRICLASKVEGRWLVQSRGQIAAT